MDLEYTRSGKLFSCNDTVGKLLMKRNLARYPTREVMAEKPAAAEISSVIGKPKRAYTRRDLQAEK